jgi:hypothetical protein
MYFVLIFHCIFVINVLPLWILYLTLYIFYNNECRQNSHLPFFCLFCRCRQNSHCQINYTKNSSECCTFNEMQIKTRLLILRSEQSLESGKTRDGQCSGWKSIPISPWIEWFPPYGGMACWDLEWSSMHIHAE